MKSDRIGSICLALLCLFGTAGAYDQMEDAMSTGFVAQDASAASLIQDFRWIGSDGDLVGDDGVPDGTVDGHFRLKLRLSQEVVVTRVSLYESNEAGDQAVQPNIWDTDPGTSWGYLGVFYDGRLINNDLEQSRMQGEVELDLYCNDLGVFVPNNSFGVQVYIQATGVTAI